MKIDNNQYCTKETCVFHTGNSELIGELRHQLENLSGAIHKLDTDMVRIISAARVRATMIGIVASIVIGGFSYMQKEITDLNITVSHGMKQRVILEEQMKHFEDEIDEIKRRMK